MIETLTTGGVVMAQVSTGEISFLVTVLITTEFAVIGFFLKRMIDGIDRKLASICLAQTKCQASLFRQYVSRTEWDHFMDREYPFVNRRVPEEINHE